MSRAAAILLLCAVSAAPTPAVAEAVPGEAPEFDAFEVGDQADLIERILELRRQLEDLEGQLSPESRRILEARRLALEAALVEEAAAAAQAEAEVTNAETATPPKADRTACNTLIPFDTTDDGVVSGADRYWRYLRIWVDSNRDGHRQESEVVHPFDLGIVEIPIGLRQFHEADNVTGDIRHGDRLHFEPVGKKNESGVLAVEATRIQRGDGLLLRSSAGETLEGLQELRPGLLVVASSGAEVAINCP